MARSKEPLRREHFNDEQWEAVGRVFDFIRRMKLKKRAAAARCLGENMEVPK